jgi:hypothetical protein
MMATVQHPSFPSDRLTVEDPAPWLEQGWILESPPAIEVAVDTGLSEEPKPRKK